MREINCSLIYSFNSHSHGVADISIKVNHSNPFKSIIDFLVSCIDFKLLFSLLFIAF